MEGARRRTADRLDEKIEEKTLAGHELMKYEARVTQVLKTVSTPSVRFVMAESNLLPTCHSRIASRSSSTAGLTSHA